MPDTKYFSNIQSKSTGDVYVVKDKDARDQIANKADNTPTFTEASTRANIASGETMPTMLGKIKKFFTDLKAVAFSGSYNDLSNKPTIPAAANNGTLTIQKNGTNVQTFTANQSTNATANITVPTKTSDLTNDSNYLTKSNLTDGAISSGVVIRGRVYGTGDDEGIIINKASNNYATLALGTHNGERTTLTLMPDGTAQWRKVTSDNSSSILTHPGKTGTVALTSDIPTSLPASDTTSTYSATGTAPVNGTAVAAALGTLDVSSVGGSGKYISAISETDGKISATATNFPTIPAAANNGTLTIQKNGTNVQTFTANQSTNATANITVPTALSDLTADATHRLVSDTEKSTWNSKATSTDITNAINALDVSSVGGAGKYISTISETNGKITATATDLVAVVNPSTTPTAEGSIWIVTT